MDTSDYRLLVSPTGKFVLGGPMGDAGLTAARSSSTPMADGPATAAARSQARIRQSGPFGRYAMRWVAKTSSQRAWPSGSEVRSPYAIGKAAPVGLFVETFGSETVDGPYRKGHHVGLRSAARRDHPRPGHLRPIYAQTAAYGHFGRTDIELPWEQTNKVEELKASV
jgi:S-adenosylmethionine synthetase